MVTPELFRRFPTPEAMAKASLPELEELIRTTGFFRNKAKSIQGAARKIIADFNGQVPQTLAELITIPGAARKTANVVLGVCFGKAEGVVVDTHVFRIARRLELAKGDTPEKVEQELMQVIAARPLDQFLAPDHPSRPAGVHCRAIRNAASAIWSRSAGRRTRRGVRESAELAVLADQGGARISREGPDRRLRSSPGTSDTFASAAGSQPRSRRVLAGDGADGDGANPGEGECDSCGASAPRRDASRWTNW